MSLSMIHPSGEVIFTFILGLLIGVAMYFNVYWYLFFPALVLWVGIAVISHNKLNIMVEYGRPPTGERRFSWSYLLLKIMVVNVGIMISLYSITPYIAALFEAK